MQACDFSVDCYTKFIARLSRGFVAVVFASALHGTWVVGPKATT